jgi:hypothetical protein
MPTNLSDKPVSVSPVANGRFVVGGVVSLQNVVAMGENADSGKPSAGNLYVLDLCGVKPRE